MSSVVHDVAETDPDVTELRTLHERLDRVVLDAYGWSHVAVPAYCGAHDVPDEPNAFEDAVAARLSALNAHRAARSGPVATNPSPSVRRMKS